MTPEDPIDNAPDPTADVEAGGTTAAEGGVDATADQEPGLIDFLADLGRSAQETADSISAGVHDAEGTVRQGLEDAETSIRDHPLLAVGIAAGLGFMLGLMLRGSGRHGEDAHDDVE